MILRIRLPVFYLLGAVICLLTIAACENRPEESELKASLGKVAEEYWTSRLVKGDLRTSYELEVQEGRPPFSEYVKRNTPANQITFLSVKAKEVKVDKDRGVVVLKVAHEISGLPKPKKGRAEKGLVLNITDKWIYTSKGWRREGPA